MKSERRWLPADQGKKPCDCDLDLDEHPYNRDHYRACNALYDLDPEHAGVKCIVIRGHEGPHTAVITHEIRWEKS